MPEIHLRRVQAAGVVLVGLLAAGAARGEKLPLRVYTTAEGLPRDQVTCIARDARGFLWFGTREGLARFDGTSFHVYGMANGLPNPSVRAVLETRAGVLWVGTESGLARLDPAADAPARAFVTQPMPEGASAIYSLLEDARGLHAGTGRGLYRVEPSGESARVVPEEIGAPEARSADRTVSALLATRRGDLWAGTGSGLYRLRPGAPVLRLTVADGLPHEDVRALAEDVNGRVWVGTLEGLARLTADPAPGNAADVVYKYRDLREEWVLSLLAASDGTVWAGTYGALVHIADPGAPRPALRVYTNVHGLSGWVMRSLAEDPGGNIWAGSEGAMRVAHGGLVSFQEADGLRGTSVRSIFEDRAGALCVRVNDFEGAWLARFDGSRFLSLRPNVPKEQSYWGWGWGQVQFQDRAGDWWVPTKLGLLRWKAPGGLAAVSSRPATRRYTTRDGLPGDEIFRVFEDRAGDVWISTLAPTGNGLARWTRARDAIEDQGGMPGLPPMRSGAPTVFREDRAGNLWVGFSEGLGVARVRDGRARRFGAADGIPGGWIRDLHLDAAGRLWVGGTIGGAACVENPAAETPRITRLGRAEGLSSDWVDCITEDLEGRIYFGTSLGVDRFEPATRRIRRFTVADGLVRGELRAAYRDRTGAIWFGSSHGLSRLVPAPDPPAVPPPVVLVGVRAGGVEARVPESGSLRLDLPDLAPGDNQMQVDYVGLAWGTGESVTYEYRLEGTDDDWSPPTAERRVNFASLAPGRYRFEVRAVSSTGLRSPEPAVVSFRVLPPFWGRAWFLALVAGALAAGGFALARLRVRRILALEGVRARIAADLHDDIGSSLSRISILSEVARRKAGGGEAGVLLGEIAETARSLVGSMSDAVWSIDPAQDDLGNVVARMRMFATDVLDGKGIAWTFDAPGEPDARLAPETRRELFLVFKEAVTNVARHSGARSARLRLELLAGSLTLEISDDGHGFDVRPAHDLDSSLQRGRGLLNMQVRAKRMGGSLTLAAEPGRGARLVLVLPLGRGGA